MVRVGEKLQRVTLIDHHGIAFDSAQVKNKRLLLSFHPLAWTPVCAKQMKALERNREAFKKARTVAVGVSVDSVPCKTAWAKSIKVEHTRLLSDFWPHGGLAEQLGIFRIEHGFSERANIIADSAGMVIFVKIYPIREVPDIKEILDFLALT
ncbi:MAG: redoxin domain-containing protein [Syntrophaceae bacterium]